MTRALAVLVATLLLTMSAVAETGQRLDCGRMASDIDRMLCQAPDPGRTDRKIATLKMSGAYSALLSRLGAAGREHLTSDQARWLRVEKRFCVDSVGATSPKA